MSVGIEILNSLFNKKDFSCGKEMLDNYLRTQAGQDVKRKLCVVFVLVDGTTIKGYYTLSNSSVSAEFMPNAVKKKMPGSYKTLPVTLLGRLAVDIHFKGQGLGTILLIDALKRSFDVANKSLGSIGVIVDPLDDDATAFYQKFGFILLPDSGKMFLPMVDIAALGL
jgi:predicted GNAT family N-acyltransferase